MAVRHGSLENEILSAIWSLQEKRIENISVNQVLEYINSNNKKITRAYTTLKTVMDRLVEKELLERYKLGKKFCYKTLSSRQEMAEKAIKRLAKQYFNNDMPKLMSAIEKQCLTLK